MNFRRKFNEITFLKAKEIGKYHVREISKAKLEWKMIYSAERKTTGMRISLSLVKEALNRKEIVTRRNISSGSSLI
jgi:hypothetical protein